MVTVESGFSVPSLMHSTKIAKWSKLFAQKAIFEREKVLPSPKKHQELV